MNDKSFDNTSDENKKSTPDSEPNELGGFYFSSFLKIFDPATNKVILQKRADA